MLRRSQTDLHGQPSYINIAAPSMKRPSPAFLALILAPVVFFYVFGLVYEHVNPGHRQQMPGEETHSRWWPF